MTGALSVPTIAFLLRAMAIGNETRQTAAEQAPTGWSVIVFRALNVPIDFTIFKQATNR